jgi:putative hydrolase of the HAD superfamily
VSPYSCVVFDFGGVIGHPQEGAFFAKAASVAGLQDDGATARFRDAYRRYRGEYDRGTLDGALYWRTVLERSGGRPDAPIDALIRLDTDSWTSVNEAVLKLMRALQREGMVLALLSNMPQELADIIRREHGAILELFTSVTFSCDVKAIKPEPMIYERALEDVGLAPGACLFVDDTPANVEGALRVGMGGVLFRVVDDVRGALRRD